MSTYRARTEGVVLDELDDGLVAYDTRTHRAHWLPASSAAAWRACAEGADERAVARALRTDVTACTAVLDGLVEAGLVETVDGVSRRSLLASAAKVGAAGALAAPIVSAIVPVAAAHASTGGSTGSNPPPSNPNSYVLQSGPGAPATKDPNNLADIYDPRTSTWSSWSPAYNYATQGGYATIPGTGWVSYYNDPNGVGPAGVLTSVDPVSTFNVPAGAVNPQITGQFLVDDSGAVYVNGNYIGPDTGSYTTPTPFTAPLHVGSNYLSFQIYNLGGPTGVDYQATVSWS